MCRTSICEPSVGREREHRRRGTRGDERLVDGDLRHGVDRHRGREARREALQALRALAREPLGPERLELGAVEPSVVDRERAVRGKGLEEQTLFRVELVLLGKAEVEGAEHPRPALQRQHGKGDTVPPALEGRPQPVAFLTRRTEDRLSKRDRIGHRPPRCEREARPLVEALRGHPTRRGNADHVVVDQPHRREGRAGDRRRLVDDRLERAVLVLCGGDGRRETKEQLKSPGELVWNKGGRHHHGVEGLRSALHLNQEGPKPRRRWFETSHVQNSTTLPSGSMT